MDIILPVASDIPPLPDAVKSCVFTDIRKEWNVPSVVQFDMDMSVSLATLRCAMHSPGSNLVTVWSDMICQNSVI